MDKPARPILNLPLTRTEIILDRLALAGVLLLIAILTATWPDLPARIPTHFGLSGEPNAWGSRNSVLFGPILALAIYVGLTILQRYPHLYNYPRRLTPENAERMYRLGRGLLAWLKTEIIWLFAWLTTATVQVATRHAPGLGTWPLWVALAVVYGTVTVFTVAMFRAK